MFERGVPKLRTERSNIMFFLYVRTFEKTCTDVHDGRDISQWELNDKWLVEDVNSDNEEENIAEPVEPV